MEFKGAGWDIALYYCLETGFNPIIFHHFRASSFLLPDQQNSLTMRNILNLALVIAMTSCMVSCGPPAPRGDDALWKEKLNRGMDAIRQNKWEEAQSFLDQSLVEAEKFGKSDKRVAGSLVNLASCYANAKEFDKAIEVSRRALAIDEKEFGPGYEVAFDLNQLGTYLAVSGQHEEAVKELSRAVGMRAKLEGSKGRLQLGTSLSNLGESYLELGSLEKAEKVLKEALTIFREEESPQEYFSCLEQLDRVYAKSNSASKSVRLYTTEGQTLEKKYGAESPWVRVLQSKLGKSLMERGEYRLAEDLFKKLLAKRLKIESQKGLMAAEAANALAVCLFKQEKFKEALPYFEQAMKLAASENPKQAEAIRVNYEDCKARAEAKGKKRSK